MICLLVVAKAPVAGLAKTRLCPPATPEQAADIAAASLLDTLDAVLAVPDAVPVVALTGELAMARRRTELGKVLATTTVIPQRGTGFPARLANAHRDVARLHPGLPVLQIGMDTPQLRAKTLTDAVHMLAGFDAVLGPAEDGGWWGLGLHDPTVAEVLRSVPTSLADTGARTRHALRRLGLRVFTLPRMSDVDTMVDATRVAALVPDGRFAAAVSHLGTHHGGEGHHLRATGTSVAVTGC